MPWNADARGKYKDNMEHSKALWSYNEPDSGESVDHIHHNRIPGELER